MNTTSHPESALKHYFGFDRFLDGQREVVDAVLNGEDVCVIMPTGAGKSICYQLPILMELRGRRKRFRRGTRARARLL